METHLPQPVRPGAGLAIDHEPLAPIRRQLKEGVYEFDLDAQDSVRAALADPTVPKEEAERILNIPANKVFRNAYTSAVIDPIWPAYNAMVNGENAALYGLEINGTTTSLQRLSDAEVVAQPLPSIADTIAQANQDVATHLVCAQLRDGEVPVVSGDPEKDAQYYANFVEQTTLLVERTGNYFPALPEEFDPSSKFLASGLLVLRTHVFGMPNLISGVAEHQGIALTPDQHRTGVQETMVKMTEHYLPPAPIAIGVNLQIIDLNTLRLKPEQWTSNHNPDSFVAFPLPGLIEAVNRQAAGQELPVQTNCPAFHSRVKETEAQPSAKPLPRALITLAMGQLDQWYYPESRRLHQVSAPPAERSVEAADGNSFPDGIFISQGEQAMQAIDQAVEATPEQCPMLDKREQQVLALLGAGETDTKPFSSFMREVADTVVLAEMGQGFAPSGMHDQIQRFYRRALVDADGTFDANRDVYSSATDDTESFADALFAIELTRTGEVPFTIGDAAVMVSKLIQNPALYPERARKLLKADVDSFISQGVLEMSRADAPNLDGAATQRIKETTNGLHAALLFDLAHGEYADVSGYACARDRYIAAKLAYQYHDEVLDVSSDAREGSANLLTAFARDEGEIEALQAAHEELSAQLPELQQALDNPKALAPYLRTVRRVAPKGYARIVARQKELLAVANLPYDTVSKISLS
ncbi:MAG TPA: hypothetical protein VLA92_03135 [Candidatus Saccharimonadales bacterium]|nr:hypothetical protein [Candidatus Saccharimonadales bacterium]